MKKIAAVIAAIMLVLSLLLATGCETVLDTYESDTFELGDTSTR